MGDELDELYRAKPEGFTALRTQLAAAAKKAGDPQRAKRISGARKPTTAAWVVNMLAHTSDARERLGDLRARMRAAHATMNGDRIRELTAEQRHLVDELTRAALAAAELRDPPSALRDDVSGTLQAAIADPDVAARLGQLTKAERWSGFGDFGDTTIVSTGSRSTEAAPSVRQKPKRSAADRRADREAKQAETDRARERAEEQAKAEAEQARADLGAAERAKADADAALPEYRAQVESARQLVEQARKALHQAERQLSSAESAHAAAEQATHDAAKSLREARARVKRR